jgi:lipoprotein NlpI
VLARGIKRGLLDMRMVVAIPLASLATFILSVAQLQAADVLSGSGVVVGANGEIVTNAHVVDGCRTIAVQYSSRNSKTAVLVVRDQRNDLAVVRAAGVSNPPTSVALFREGAPLRAGETIVALGYPLSGLLATTANLSVGNVSALAGLGDDSRYVQISAPVQPGNSGGPLLDSSGHLVGIVTAKLNAARVARFTGDIPQNVNFALKAEVVRTFLDGNSIAYQTARSERQLSPADIGDIARPFTVHIKCERADSRSAAAPTISSPPLPSRIDPSQQVDWCRGNNAQDPNLMINGCTAMIQSGRWTGRDLALAFHNRGFAYGLKDNYDRAIADLSEAIAIDPKFVDAYANRGLKYIQKREYDLALEDFYRSTKLNPRFAGAYFGRGNVYLAKADYDRAIEEFDQATQFDPKYVQAYNGRGGVYLAKADYDRAIEEFDQATQLDPKYVYAYIGRGIVHFLTSKFQAAAAEFQRTIELNDKKITPYAMLWRYLARARAGENGATELASNATRLSAKDWPGPIVELYLGQRSPAKMLSAAAKPDDRCDAQFYLGEWLLLRGKRAEAKAALLTAAAGCSKIFLEYTAAIAELRRLGD